MGGKHPPGYQARRRAVERFVLAWFKANHPRLYKRAWTIGETRIDEQRKAEG